MKIFRGLFLGKNTFFSGLIAIAIISLIVLGCTCDDDNGQGVDNTDVGSKTEDAPAVPKGYWGEWTGEDGTTVSIRADGTGDYKSSGFNVTGGSVTVNESSQTLSITFVGIGKTLKIDKVPSSNKMTLNGVVYTKDGSSLDSASIPPSEELQGLARKTMLDFNQAIQKKDFTDLHSTLSKPFQKQASPERLKEIFDDFVKIKANFTSVAELDANFTGAPEIVSDKGYEMLQLRGYYPTTPRRTKFEFDYILEEGVWKPAGIHVNTKD